MEFMVLCQTQYEDNDIAKFHSCLDAEEKQVKKTWCDLAIYTPLPLPPHPPPPPQKKKKK